MQGQSTLNQTISYTKQIPAGTSSKNDRLHPAANQQPRQTLPRMNMGGIGVKPISTLLQNTQTPSNSMVPNSASINYPPSTTSNIVPTGMLHYRHSSMPPTVSVSAQNVHQSSSPAAQAQIVVQQQIQRQQQRQNVQHVARTSAAQNVHQNIPTNRQSVQVQRQRVSSNNMPQNTTRTRQNLPSSTVAAISQNNVSSIAAGHIQLSQSGMTQIMAGGQNNPAHSMPQMIASVPRNMPPVQIVPNHPPPPTAAVVSRAIPQTTPDPRSLPAQSVEPIASSASSIDLTASSKQQNNAQVAKEAQKLKALAYFGDMLNKSKYNEDDRQFCREHRSIFAAAMDEMGNEDGYSLNELFQFYLPTLEETYIDTNHPRIIERKEVLRLALNMAFIDVFQIGPDYDHAET